MKFFPGWLLALWMLPASLAAVNLLEDGENKNVPWKIWGSAPPSGKIRAQILSFPNAGPNGEKIIKLNDFCDDHNPYFIKFVDIAPVKKGQTYLLKFKALAQQGQEFLFAVMGQRKKTATTPGKYLGGPSVRFIGTGQWKEYSAELTNIPATMDKLGAAFIPFPPTKDNTRKAELAVMDVSLELDTSTPAEDPQTRFGKWKYTARDLCINTDLVKNGKAAVTIVGDQNLAQELVKAIQAKTGVTVSVSAKAPAQGNIITIGNRDRNDFVCTLYNHHYTLQDAKYPGKGGYEVRSLHNPYGDRRNIILCAGSDLEGDRMAVKKLAEKINALPKGKNLTLGYIADVKLDPSYQIPADAKDVKLWEQSVSYGNKGYFGWNSLSKNLALFYVTGKKHYADEFLRLAFPKDKATEKELFKRDGEAYMDDFSDPIRSVYHYCGIMMILYWDLVEESPVWTEADRKKVTEAFYRQLHYTLTKNNYTNPYRFANRKIFRTIGRHHDWEGAGLYAVARFFNKHFPCPEAPEAIRLVKNFMDPHFEDLCYGTTSRFWAHSNMEPNFTYAILSGDRKYINNHAIMEYARDLLITCDWSNRPDKKNRDSTMGSSPLCSLLQIAYLTQDDAFVEMMKALPLDKECFRLGQSFYPGKPYGRNRAEESNGRWEAYRGAEWILKPTPTFPAKYAVNVMSYHDTTDDTGDYWMYDTSYANGLREVARALAIYRLRINGVPILLGHGNTMRLYSDGTSVAPQPYYAKILNYGVSGPFVYAEAVVPKCDGFDWKRTAILRKRQYMVFIDELTPLKDLVSGEFYNDFIRVPGEGFWQKLPATNEYKLAAVRDDRKRNYIFSSSYDCSLNAVPLPWTKQPMTLRIFGMKNNWKKGETLKFVTILRPGEALQTPSTAQVGDQVAMALPEPAMFQWVGDKMELLTKDGKLTSGPGQWQFAANAPVPADTVRQMLAARKTTGAVRQSSGTAPAPAFKADSVQKTIWRSRSITRNGQDLTILTGKKELTVLNNKLNVVLKKTFAAEIGAVEYQSSKDRILVGCKNEQLIAIDLRGKEVWRFTSQMHPQLHKFGPYWHKSAIPGIRSILAATWPDGTEQIFVGSAGTLEILDADGKFLDRKYILYGPVTSLYMQQDPARLWIFRRTGGHPYSHLLTQDGKLAMQEIVFDANRTHMGTFGFSAVGRRLLIFKDGKMYGDFYGTQNRIMLWDGNGKPLAHANLGTDNAANSEPFGKDLRDSDHIRLLKLLDDGTVCALTRRERAYFWTPDLKLKKMIVLPGIPNCGTTDGKAVYAGMGDGTILKITPDGTISAAGKLPAKIQTLDYRNGRLFAGDVNGNTALW